MPNEVLNVHGLPVLRMSMSVQHEFPVSIGANATARANGSCSQAPAFHACQIVAS